MRNRFEPQSAASTSSDPSRPKTASHSGPVIRSRIEQRVMNSCRSGGSLCSTSSTRKSTTAAGKASEVSPSAGAATVWKVTPNWTPTLELHETAGACRLRLVGLAHGNGNTLQEASDDLIDRLVDLVLAVRSSGLKAPGELGPPDPRLLEFIWELGEWRQADTTSENGSSASQPVRNVLVSARSSDPPSRRRDARRRRPDAAASLRGVPRSSLSP
jgi:hypothetical protein